MCQACGRIHLRNKMLPSARHSTNGSTDTASKSLQEALAAEEEEDELAMPPCSILVPVPVSDEEDADDSSSSSDVCIESDDDC